MTTSARSRGNHAEFYPKLAEAGVGMLDFFKRGVTLLQMRRNLGKVVLTLEA